VAKKVLLCYNPAAGNGLIRGQLDRIIEFTQAEGLRLEPVRLEGRPEQLTEIFAALDSSNYRQIIAAGGDGTIHHVVNAMLESGTKLPLALLPAGTANDFAGQVLVPTKPEAALAVALGGVPAPVDVGKAGGRYFINVLALGSLVDVSRRTDPTVKNTLGLLSYYVTGMSELPNLRALPVTVQSDTFTDELSVYFILVLNSSSAGGFKKLAPAALVDDGLLDVLIFKEMPMPLLAPLLFEVLAGQHPQNPNVVSFQTAALSISCSLPVSVDMDGESGGELPLDIEVCSGLLQVYQPLKVELLS
jgi:YegS/Rv2252/BmrU family lipid kinase